MNIKIIGAHPLATDGNGALLSHIGTHFVKTNTLVTLPKMPHAFQQMAYRKQLEEERGGVLAEDEWEAISASAVDLIMRGGELLIRPSPERMPLAFEADEALQEIVPKHRIRFLHAQEAKVRQAIRERGEYWRISFPPASKEMIAGEIRASIVAIGQRPIYYYNAAIGIRYLTLEKFASLAELSDDDLRAQLDEIKVYSQRRNRSFQRELDFFAADGDKARKEIAALPPFSSMDATQLRDVYAQLLEHFTADVPAAIRKDDTDNPVWRSKMFACLSADGKGTQSDSIVPELSPEFFRQIFWHPGARIEKGMLVFDPVFEYAKKHPEEREVQALCDERVKGVICNYVREFGTVRHVNIGGILPDLRRQAPVGGHRSYLAEIMLAGADKPILRIIRFQRWGVREHLDEGKDLLRAIMETLDYTDYTKNRRLGCWELGMPISVSQTSNMIQETYNGSQSKYHGTPFWTVYFERDFIPGTATDKISDDDLKGREFPIMLAHLLGKVAAPNLVVGRVDSRGEVTYDSGDEVVVFNSEGLPDRIVVADHASTFADVESPFERFLHGYAHPVVSRWKRLAEPEVFMRTYLESFMAKLCEMKQNRRMRPHVFDALFEHSRQGTGTFADRWRKALRRLEEADPAQFINRLEQTIREETNA